MRMVAAVAVLSICVVGSGSGAWAEVTFLANFNQGLDADYSLGTPKGAVTGGAKLTTSKQGYPFAGETVSEALDLSFTDPAASAAVEYECPVRDLRSGTIQLWIKTGFPWDQTAQTPETKWDERTFLVIPTQGGNFNGIRLDWYNRFGPWFHFYIYDGENQGQIGVKPIDGERLGLDLRANVWHYVVATWTPTQMRLFLDGKLVEERTLEKALALGAPDGPLHLGGGPLRELKLAPAQALIDGLRLSNRALFADQKEIAVPQEPLTAKEDTGPGQAIAVGGPGTVMYAKPRKTYQAPRLAAAPVVDGDLSDAVWKAAPRATGFVLLATEHPYVDAQTVVQAGWDDQNLYLGITCHENQMGNLKVTAHGPDSAAYGDDAVEMLLGPRPEQVSDYYQLVANTADGIYDGHGYDSKWNGNWPHAVKKYADRWTLEVAVPFADLKAPAPAQGTLWGWNIARDRSAGGGVDALSSLAEVLGGWHSPEQFDKLLFVEKALDVPAFEKQFNGDFLAATREEMQRKQAEADKELMSGKRLLARAGVPDTTGEARAALEGWKGKYQAMLAKPDADLEEYNLARLSFRDFQKALEGYGQAVNKLGFVSAGNLPADLKPGVTRAGNYWYVSSPQVTAAVDANTGILCGLYDQAGKPLLRWSYDLYFLETPKTTSRSDERLDEVSDIRAEGKALKVTCKNPLIAGATIVKRYYLAPVAGQERIVCKEFSISGNPAEKTLISLVSRTYFEEAFRENCYYHRVKPTGTMGDPRSVIPAKDVKEPLLLHFLFNVGAAANLCAVNTAENRGVGEYWYKANGKWVMPNGYEGNKSYFTETGWDMSWFVTFIGPQAQSGEVRYHLFTGDRITFHQEYRDLPERQAVINAVPVGEAARQRRYEFCLGPKWEWQNWDNPKAQWGQITNFLYPRLRSDEHASHYGTGFRDLWYGDYPTGDAAQLHYDYGEPPKLFPAKEVRDGILEGRQKYPRVESGWYHTPQDICKLSAVYKQHPEWVWRDRLGQEVPSGWHPLYVKANWSPEWVDYLLGRLCAEMDYYGMQVMYLDFSITGPIPDWGTGVVRHSDVTADFLTRLYREVQKRGGVMFLNSTTFDGLHDLGYWEGFNHYDGWGDWRNMADALMMRRLYDRPEAKSIPLYWSGGEMFGSGNNYRDYTNLVLSLMFSTAGCMSDPYSLAFPDGKGGTDWAANYAHQMAYYDTAFEAYPSQWTDVDLKPCWYRDPTTEVEAYAFRKGNAWLLTAQRHDKETQDVALSADAGKLGLAAGQPVFVWQYWPRDPDKFPRKGGPQPEGWQYLFTQRTCQVLSAGVIQGRLKLTVPGLEWFLPRIFSVTQVPAVFCSVEGQKTNLLLPVMLGGRITGTFKAGGYEVKVTSKHPAEVLVYAPGGLGRATVAGREATAEEEKYGETRFLRVSVPAGGSVVAVR
jgi:hypothetical protein